MKTTLALLIFSTLLLGCINSTSQANTSINNSGFTAGVSWQWQLSGVIDTSHEVDVYDVDLFETPQRVIDELHSKNVLVVCYFSAGTFEDFRSDATDFPKSVIGNSLDEWPGEKWLDVSNYESFSSVIEKRLDLAMQKKCDAVEPDNVDGYIQDSGFSISYSDQIEFNKWLARKAHARGLKVGLKNDLDQITDLVSEFDFAVNEQCFEFQECEKLLPFIKQNKAVLGVEYNLEKNAFCFKAREMNYSWLKMNLELNGSRGAC